MVTLGFIALETSWMDVAANSLRISRHLDEVRRTGSLDAVFFPEASLTGFACLEDPVALTDVDASISRLHKSAQELGLESFIGGFVRSEGNIYNSIIQIGTGVESPRVVYSKQNLFEYAGEQYLCSPGQDTGVVSIQGLSIGVLICFDLRSMRSFTELVDRGVDLVVVVANWPEVRHQHFTSLLQVRAMDYGIPVIGLNRSGRDPVVGTYKGGAFGYFQNGEEVIFESRGEMFLTVLSKELITTKAAVFRPGLRT